MGFLSLHIDLNRGDVTALPLWETNFHGLQAYMMIDRHEDPVKFFEKYLCPFPPVSLCLSFPLLLPSTLSLLFSFLTPFFSSSLSFSVSLRSLAFLETSCVSVSLLCANNSSSPVIFLHANSKRKILKVSFQVYYPPNWLLLVSSHLSFIPNEVYFHTVIFEWLSTFLPLFFVAIVVLSRKLHNWVLYEYLIHRKCSPFRFLMDLGIFFSRNLLWESLVCF